jgi:hypothetical protein
MSLEPSSSLFLPECRFLTKKAAAIKRIENQQSRQSSFICLRHSLKFIDAIRRTTSINRARGLAFYRFMLASRGPRSGGAQNGPAEGHV